MNSVSAPFWPWLRRSPMSGSMPRWQNGIVRLPRVRAAAACIRKSPAGLLGLLFALSSWSNPRAGGVVDVVPIDCKHGASAGCGELDQPQHRTRRDQIAGEARDNRSYGVAGVIASLRPTRPRNARRPTIPRLMAAIAGGNTASQQPITSCAVATGQNWGNMLNSAAPAATTTAPTTMRPHFHVVQSMSAPADARVTTVAIPPIIMTTPIRVESHAGSTPDRSQGTVQRRP